MRPGTDRPSTSDGSASASDADEPMFNPQAGASGDGPPITRIEPQKGSISRFSLFTRDGFLLGVSAECMVRHGIHVGMSASEARVRQWREEEAFQKLLDRALRLLARREHSERELAEKLSQPMRPTRGRQAASLPEAPDAELIDRVMQTLREQDPRRDERFAAQFIHQASTRRGWGETKILAMLKAKGIASELAHRLLREKLDAEASTEQACRSLEKKKWYFSRFQDPHDRQGRMARFLQRRGFPSEIIHAAIRRFPDHADVQKPDA